MENTSKALIIAAAVLLSMMIVSLLLYTGKSFGKIARAEQEAKLTQDKKAFNQEYEVYDKSLMYGTDVLSCLNKAQSNNQKYVNNNYFGRDNLGSETRMEYLIDVEVTLHKTIEESVRVYTLDGKGKRKLELTKEWNTEKPFKSGGSGAKFDVPTTIIWYYFENGNVKKMTGKYSDTLWASSIDDKSLKTQEFPTKLEGTSAGITYNLFSSGNTDDGEIGKLSALLSTATLTEQTIVKSPYSGGSDEWYSATWRTAAYDFKTRKFKCNGIEYSEETGYISKIKFEEVTSF